MPKFGGNKTSNDATDALSDDIEVFKLLFKRAKDNSCSSKKNEKTTSFEFTPPNYSTPSRIQTTVSQSIEGNQPSVTFSCDDEEDSHHAVECSSIEPISSFNGTKGTEGENPIHLSSQEQNYEDVCISAGTSATSDELSTENSLSSANNTSEQKDTQLSPFTIALRKCPTPTEKDQPLPKKKTRTNKIIHSTSLHSNTTPSKASSQTTLFNQSQTDQRPKKLAAVFAKGIKIYSEKQIKEADRMEPQYFQFWNEKAESLCRNPRFQKWSKLNLEDVINSSWTL